jgi:predicted ribosomally synthesized peptide with SipW-like signal peptide
MKKILGLSVAAILVMGLVGGGTWAYFSDTETSTGNFFAVGTLDLEVESENPLTSTLVDGSSAVLAPGDSFTPVSIDCTNVGNITGDLWVRLTSVTGSGGYDDGPNGTSSEPEYVAEGGTYVSGVAQDDNTPQDDIDTVMTVDAQVSSTNITGLSGQTMSSVEDTWFKIADDVANGATITLDLGATLDTTATNEYQGDFVTFTLEFSFQQVDQSPS